ncbi:CSG1/SUR1-like protein [Lodderomyces elongisporus]|uniref:CSG1/SUR1-like protein n=1 Tax=Lodderomyces elongisporus TaxID=36914 RepID=UPI002922F67C|nr:CSG1/SUR1-like protein [Lodderomyces elongisporus]WLF79836.1 CSG1/SUR1-like protein [Lodderomyces elongisporus]
MRKELKYILWAHVALVIYLIYLSFDLITLLHDDTYSDALIDFELNPSKNSGQLNKPALIPKIIHQTYKSENIPDIWKAGQQACIDLHEDYQYILWTDEMAREFISEEFPWFLKTWDNYKYNIQRADAIRYFALYHYGGIYIDLDDGCEKKLDPLLTVPAFVRKTIPTGISNDVMGSVPNHPFFLKAIESLKNYQRNWLVPYITIMISTGPLFLSVIWKQYKRWGVPEAGKVRILMPENYKGYNNSFFAIAPGSSWHMGDANFIKSLANHLVLAVIGGCLIAVAILAIEYLFYSFIISTFFKKFTAKIGNFFMWTITKILRFFNLDKFIESSEALKQYKLVGLGEDEERTFCAITEKFKQQEQLPLHVQQQHQQQQQQQQSLQSQDKDQQLHKQKHPHIAQDNQNKKNGINLMQFLKNSNVKRRSRKDSNLPFNIEMMEQLAQDTTIVIADDTSSLPNTKQHHQQQQQQQQQQQKDGAQEHIVYLSTNDDTDVDPDNETDQAFFSDGNNDADISANDEFNDDYNDNIV